MARNNHPPQLHPNQMEKKIAEMEAEQAAQQAMMEKPIKFVRQMIASGRAVKLHVYRPGSDSPIQFENVEWANALMLPTRERIFMVVDGGEIIAEFCMASGFAYQVVERARVDVLPAGSRLADDGQPK